MSRRYQVELSEEQVELISKACEMVARIHMGQLDMVADVVTARTPTERFIELKDRLLEIEPLITGMHKHAYYGIRSDQIEDKARQAFDLYQTFRHRMAWDRTPEGGMFTQFDEPFHLSTQQSLPIIKEIKTDEGR